MNDPDDYRSRNTLKIPQTALGQYLKDNAELDDINVKLFIDASKIGAMKSCKLRVFTDYTFPDCRNIQ